MSWLKKVQENMQEDIISQRLNAPYLNNADRMDVYSHGYYARVADSMAKDFPIISWTLGRKAFDELVKEYIQNFPSHEYNINIVGKRFSTFILTHRLLQQYPFLLDLACYEWCLLECQSREWKQGVDFNQFQSLSMEQWIDSRFSFQPSIILVHSSWALDHLHTASINKIPYSPEMLVHQYSHYILYQQKEGSYSTSVQKLEYDTLSLLIKKTSLGDVMEAIGNEEMVQSVFGWFQKWNEKEWITNVTFESHESE